MPYTYKTITFKSFDGCPLNVRVCGTEGPMLLLIHGGGTDSDFYKDSAEYFSRYFHVVSYDRRCHVRSGAKGHIDMLKAHAKDAAALIKEFSSDGTAYVIAHSMGGFVGMKLCELHPEMIKRIIFHEPVYDFSENFHFTSLHEATHMLNRSDDRGRHATEDEIANIMPDTLAMLKYDLGFFFTYKTPVETLKKLDVYFGVGEQSKGVKIYSTTLKTAEKVGAPLIWFPGSHNSAFQLPFEFAALSTATLLKKD